MTDLLPSAGAPTPRPARRPTGPIGRGGGAANPTRRRHVRPDRRPHLRPGVHRRRRGRSAHRRRGTRRPEEPDRRRRSGRPNRAAHTRGAARRPRRLARRAGAHGQRQRNAADRDQQHPQAPPRRARPRPERSRQPDHRRRDRPVGLRSDDDDQQRRCAAHQGRPPRRRRGRTPADPLRPHRPAVGWTTIEAPYDAIDCLYAAGAVAIDAGLDRASSFNENEFAVLRSGSQSALVRAVDDEFVLLSQHTPEAWGCVRAARSSVRPRAAARPRHLGHRARRACRNRQDDPRDRRRARAGRRAEPLRAAGGVPPAGPGRPGRRRLPARRPRREARSVDGRHPRCRRRAHRPWQHQGRPGHGRRTHQPGPTLARVGDLPPGTVAAASSSS